MYIVVNKRQIIKHVEHIIWKKNRISFLFDMENMKNNAYIL